METVDLTQLPLLTFNDFIILIAWIISVVFAAHIISHIAISIVRFISSLAHKHKPMTNYNVDYNARFARFKIIPTVKGIKKNHGRTIPIFNKRR